MALIDMSLFDEWALVNSYLFVCQVYWDPCLQLRLRYEKCLFAAPRHGVCFFFFFFSFFVVLNAPSRKQSKRRRRIEEEEGRRRTQWKLSPLNSADGRKLRDRDNVVNESQCTQVLYILSFMRIFFMAVSGTCNKLCVLFRTSLIEITNSNPRRREMHAVTRT